MAVDERYVLNPLIYPLYFGLGNLIEPTNCLQRGHLLTKDISKVRENELFICHPTQVNGSDIQRKVVSTRIVSTPAFRPAHLQRRPTLANAFFGFKHSKGEYKGVPHWGSALE